MLHFHGLVSCAAFHASQTLIDLLVDPINILTDTHIDARTIPETTMLSPRNDAIKCLAICERLRGSLGLVAWTGKNFVSALPSSEQTSGPPLSPSQASEPSTMEPAQNMPSGRRNQLINLSGSECIHHTYRRSWHRHRRSSVCTSPLVEWSTQQREVHVREL